MSSLSEELHLMSKSVGFTSRLAHSNVPSLIYFSRSTLSLSSQAIWHIASQLKRRQFKSTSSMTKQKCIKILLKLCNAEVTYAPCFYKYNNLTWLHRNVNKPTNSTYFHTNVFQKTFPQINYPADSSLTVLA